MTKMKYDKMKKYFMDETVKIKKGESTLLKTGAKAYYKGGGWWKVSGYAYDGADIAVFKEFYLN